MAAGFPRPQFQLGRADRLDRGDGVSSRLPALLLYAGGIFWTLGYDTIYAHQDKEDDAFVGVHSTARLFGSQSGRWIAVFYILALLGFAAAGAAAGLGWPYWAALAGVSLQLLWQVRALNTDDPADCLRRFRSNRWSGWTLLAGIVAARVIQNGI